MSSVASSGNETFTIPDYHRARPFSSFLPGIAGQNGKPMWVFYTNRGQCISSFGVRNKNGAMLEFYPANKAYALTPRLGFRTFLLIGSGKKTVSYEPFSSNPGPSVEQTLRLRMHEIELEETNPALGLRINVVFFNAPQESVPLFIRQVEIQNLTRKPIPISLLDGLPLIVPYGLSDFLVKSMSRTMEAFTEVLHEPDHLPFFKLKIEPSDRPEIEWIEGGFFNFSLLHGKVQRILTDPEAVFGPDTGLERPVMFQQKKALSWKPRLTSLTPSAFTASQFTLAPGGRQTLHSFFGQAPRWDVAHALRQRIQRDLSYVQTKRGEAAGLLRQLTDAFALHSSQPALDPYSRQTFLDNALRGGVPWVLDRPSGSQVFHYYSRKHGDMERDYNFFEVSPTYFSQGNGNFRDVNQNRRSEALLYPGVEAANIETFFNLLQLDGYNPLVIQFEKFYLREEDLPRVETLVPEKAREAWRPFLTKPFNPGELMEKLLDAGLDVTKARRAMEAVLRLAKKIQDASHGEGFWIDHWTYNLDLIENFVSVYPDQMKATFVDRRDFTYFDNDHVVQPRHRKYVRREDGAVRQIHAVMQDAEKTEQIRLRRDDPNKVRTLSGKGPIYQSSLLAKIVGLLAIKAATLDPFGVGIEMEAEKPGWCDALNGLPGLLASSVNESFELRRWVGFVRERLPEMLAAAETHPFAEEVADLIKTVREALTLAKAGDFYKTWDTLASLRERFRERTRLGVSGQEVALSREEIESFLDAAAKVLDNGLPKAFVTKNLCVSYFINEAREYEALPPAPAGLKNEKPVQNVKILRFDSKPVSPFLEGPVHALRVMNSPAQARALYRAVKRTELWDAKLGMYRLNVPLTKESYEIGRNKVFTPGWLENESIFLHMAYKYLLETLRSGLTDEFFEDFRSGLVAYQKTAVYGRSTFENSSFIVSSRFPDARLHGAGFVARLTGATAEWISMVLHMGLGRQPFQWRDGELLFEPRPTLPSWLFQKKPVGGFPGDSFGFRIFGGTWIVYHNPLRRDTFGKRPLRAVRYDLRYTDGHEAVHLGEALPDEMSRDLRSGQLSRLLIELGAESPRE